MHKMRNVALVSALLASTMPLTTACHSASNTTQPKKIAKHKVKSEFKSDATYSVKSYYALSDEDNRKGYYLTLTNGKHFTFYETKQILDSYSIGTINHVEKVADKDHPANSKTGELKILNVSDDGKKYIVTFTITKYVQPKVTTFN